MSSEITTFILLVGTLSFWIYWIYKFSKAQSIKKAKKNFEKYQSSTSSEELGTLIMTIWGRFSPSHSEKIDIFCTKDLCYTLVDYTNQLATRKPFSFKASDLGNVTYSYHPEKLVYTGATVGNVHTGGYHTENAYYSQKTYASGRGIVCCKYLNGFPSFLVGCVKLSPELLESAERDETIKQLFNDEGYLICKDPHPQKLSDLEQLAYNQIASTNVYQAMGIQSFYANQQLLPMKTCIDVAQWFNHVTHR